MTNTKPSKTKPDRSRPGLTTNAFAADVSLGFGSEKYATEPHLKTLNMCTVIGTWNVRIHVSNQRNSHKNFKDTSMTFSASQMGRMWRNYNRKRSQDLVKWRRKKPSTWG